VNVSRWLAEALPRAELVVIRDVGHMTNLEDPATFNAVVERFLGRLWCA
jgi:pimeloyl-ACP methyl ester carboxylesterase